MCNSVIFSEKEEKKNVNLTGNKNILALVIIGGSHEFAP